MVEVFKTNVKDPGEAQKLIERIHFSFKDYQANFDLEDCDRILRVECKSSSIHSSSLLKLLSVLGVQAEVLPDDQTVSQADND